MLMDRGDFAVIESVIEAQDDMSRLLNPIKEFFDDRVEIKGGCETSRSAIYEAYRNWSWSTGHSQPLGARRFWSRFRTEMMIRMGLTVWDKSLERRTSSDRYVIGVYVTPGFP
jgi:phage/plasmid-associated DNA primase